MNNQPPTAVEALNRCFGEVSTLENLAICRVCFAVFPCVDGGVLHISCPACGSHNVTPALASGFRIEADPLWLWSSPLQTVKDAGLLAALRRMFPRLAASAPEK